GNNKAIIDPAISITYGELLERIDNLRGYYFEKGLRKGEVVAVNGSNSVALVLMYLSLFSLGVTVTPLPQFTKREDKFEFFESSGIQYTIDITSIKDLLFDCCQLHCLNDKRTYSFNPFLQTHNNKVIER